MQDVIFEQLHFHKSLQNHKIAKNIKGLFQIVKLKLAHKFLKSSLNVL